MIVNFSDAFLLIPELPIGLQNLGYHRRFEPPGESHGVRLLRNVDGSVIGFDLILFPVLLPERGLLLPTAVPPPTVRSRCDAVCGRCPAARCSYCVSGPRLPRAGSCGWSLLHSTVSAGLFIELFRSCLDACSDFDFI